MVVPGPVWVREICPPARETRARQRARPMPEPAPGSGRGRSPGPSSAAKLSESRFPRAAASASKDRASTSRSDRISCAASSCCPPPAASGDSGGTRAARSLALPADALAGLSVSGVLAAEDCAGDEGLRPIAELLARAGATRLAYAGLGDHGTMFLIERRPEREFEADDWHLLGVVARLAQDALARIGAYR